MADLRNTPLIRIGPSRSVHLGEFAGTKVRHPYCGDRWTGSMCLACYGWVDDPRHTTRAVRL